MRPTAGPADAARVFIEGLTPGSLLVLPHGGDIPAESFSTGLSALVDQARRLDYTFVTITAATDGDLRPAGTS